MINKKTTSHDQHVDDTNDWKLPYIPIPVIYWKGSWCVLLASNFIKKHFSNTWHGIIHKQNDQDLTWVITCQISHQVSKVIGFGAYLMMDQNVFQVCTWNKPLPLIPSYNFICLLPTTNHLFKLIVIKDKRIISRCQVLFCCIKTSNLKLC